MKNSISSVARVSAGIAEMTGNIAQGVRRHASRWSAPADEPIAQSAPDNAKSRANELPRRQPALRRPAVSEHHLCTSEGAIERQGALEFDVRRFCSELEEWRAALASLLTEPRAIGYQQPVEPSGAIPDPHRSMVPYDASKSSTSLEANVADAIQRLGGDSSIGQRDLRGLRRAIA